MCQENEAAGGDCIRKVAIVVNNHLVNSCSQEYNVPPPPSLPPQVLDILYQTEDGFAVPEEEEGVPPPEEGEEEY